MNFKYIFSGTAFLLLWIGGLLSTSLHGFLVQTLQDWPAISAGVIAVWYIFILLAPPLMDFEEEVDDHCPIWDSPDECAISQIWMTFFFPLFALGSIIVGLCSFFQKVKRHSRPKHVGEINV